VSDVAPDGSPIEVYRRLPAGDEPELVHAAVPAGAAILELGAGAGRLTHRLVELGHAVTAVDESPEMLAHVRGGETVVAAIEMLRLGRLFPAVLLASHFVNDAVSRSAVLETCRVHLADGGVLVAQTYDPDLDWEQAVGGTTERDSVRVTILRAKRNGATVSAAIAYEVDGRRWEQSFEAEMLDEEALRRALAVSRFVFDRWIDRGRGWFTATAV
jgi:SAM-dependent methyltransferase